MSTNRKPPFALWVENVDPERVDAKDLWEAFARYGDMCKPREHGARAVELLPDQKAAIVNFACYDHACAALKGLQGALIGKITRPGLTLAWHKRQDEASYAYKQPTQQVMMQDRGSRERPAFFGLWVGNVHASLVQEDQFRAAFERYGDLCTPQVHGVPSHNILPESSSAFVNFARYKDARDAQKGMQGKVVGGAGPLRINASDLMQDYEQSKHQHLPVQLQQIQTGGGGGTMQSNFSKHIGFFPDVEDMCSEDGPIFELLGGEIFMFEAGDAVKLFETKSSSTLAVH